MSNPSDKTLISENFSNLKSIKLLEILFLIVVAFIKIPDSSVCLTTSLISNSSDLIL